MCWQSGKNFRNTDSKKLNFETGLKTKINAPLLPKEGNEFSVAEKSGD